MNLFLSVSECHGIKTEQGGGKKESYFIAGKKWKGKRIIMMKISTGANGFYQRIISDVAKGRVYVDTL